ncbi:hypothetical protein ACQ4PT_051358 [Festuca glaucescens]
MAPFKNGRDGLGLEDRMTSTVQKQNEIPADCSDEDPTLMLEDGNTLVGLSAPCKKMKAGRPSTSREKATYEYGCKQCYYLNKGRIVLKKGRRSRFCSICKKPG